MFQVKVSFPGGEPGQLLTREQILAAAPNADIPWLVSVGTLLPLGGAMAAVRSSPLSAGEWQRECDRLGDLLQERGDECDRLRRRVEELEADLDSGGRVNGRLESLARSLADRVASQSEILSRLAEGGVVNLIVHKDFDGGKEGEVIAPSTVAARLTDLLNDGTVGWTEKPLTASPDLSPGAGETALPVEQVTVGPDDAGEVPDLGLPADPEPAPKKKGRK